MTIYTKEKQFELIEQSPYALMEIENQYEEVCLKAVKKHGGALQYVKNPTENICIEAIKSHSCAFKYVKNPTEKICAEAIKTDSSLINSIKLKTPEICFYLYLDNYNLHHKNKNIQKGVEEFIDTNKLENIIFCIQSESYPMYIYKDLLPRENKDKYTILNLNIEAFNNLEKFLIANNTNNNFIVDSKVDTDILKKIALSNNNLIIIKDNKFDNEYSLYTKLASEIISIDELKKIKFN